MNQNRKAMISKLINHAETCLYEAVGDKITKKFQYGFLNKGSLITKEDYDVAIHRIKQKINWMKYATDAFNKSLEVLESLRK